MEKKMMKQMMMALLLAMMPFAASAQEISIGGSWANEPAKLGKNKTLDAQVLWNASITIALSTIALGDMREYYAILEIGDTVSKFESYGSYRLDSVLVGKQQMTHGEFFKTYNMYRPDFKEFLLENANTKRLSYYGKVSIDSYTYQEEVPQIDWVLSDSTKRFVDIYAIKQQLLSVVAIGLLGTAIYLKV